MLGNRIKELISNVKEQLNYNPFYVSLDIEASEQLEQLIESNKRVEELEKSNKQYQTNFSEYAIYDICELIFLKEEIELIKADAELGRAMKYGIKTGGVKLLHNDDIKRYLQLYREHQGVKKMINESKKLTKASKSLSDVRTHEEYEKIGKAVIYLAETDHEHDLFRYLDYIMGVLMLPNCDGSYDVKLLDWYRKEVNNEKDI